MKTYRPWEPERTYLLPPSTRDWLPDDHLATFILDVIDELDLGAIEDRIQEKDPRGEKPYSPRMMVALVLYGYCVGVFSARGLAQATWTDLGARVIAAEAHPHFTTINQFRLDHLEALGGLFTQILGLCAQAGMVELGHVAIDGTKIQANASKHKAMSYDRMKDTEERLRAQVEALLAKADAVDRAEDALFGVGNDGNSLPEELRHRETRRKKLREARLAMEAEAKAARKLELDEQAQRAREAATNAAEERIRATLDRRAEARERASKRLGDVDPNAIPGSQSGLPFHTLPHERDGKPKPKAQRNFTDPESRIMTIGGAFLQAYNCQIAVDEHAQVIVAQLVTNHAPDGSHFRPLLAQTHANTGAFPAQTTADAGFWTSENGAYCEAVGVNAYISTRHRRHQECAEETVPIGASLQPSAQTASGRAMEQKVQSEAGRRVYAKRKWTVEPVFGQMKEARGFRRFSLRGLAKANAEFALVCSAHNLLKLKKKRRLD